MLLSILVYAQLYGYPYAVGFVLLLLCHESGHFIAARQRGLAVGLPTFIPFVGAWINLKEQLPDTETEAFVGLAGPLAGTTAAFAVYLYALSTGSHLLLAISYSGFILNLFNLIPIVPLDGGHIVNVISSRLWLLGLPILVGVFIWHPNPLLIVIGVLAIPKVWALIRGEAPPPDPSIAPQTRYRYALEYLGLVAFLGYISTEVHTSLGHAGS